MNFEFSYLGLIFLLMLFIPNLIWTKYPPKDYEDYQKRENRSLLIFERIGEVAVTFVLLFFSKLKLNIHSLWSLWLLIAFLTMLLYEIF